MSLLDGDHGIPVISDDRVLLEIKTAGAMPIFLAEALDECNIYPTSFSKYGRVYLHYIETLQNENNNSGRLRIYE